MTKATDWKLGLSSCCMSDNYKVEDIFKAYPSVVLPEFFTRLAKCGLEIYLKKIGADFPLGERVRLCSHQGFFALGEVREYEDGPAIKPIRQFEL